MKTLLFVFLFVISSIGFAQNNYIVKTDDGRRVLLKADYTWEYIDGVSPANPISNTPLSTEKNKCQLPENFEEPQLDGKIQSQLKKGRATIEHIKAKAAKDNDCPIEEVILVSVSEKKSDGFYDFCIKGKEVSYKRVGNNILKRKKGL